MSYIIKHPILLISIFLWLGFVLAISFMEAWLKFRAPGVTLPVGLSIGRLIFSVLNKIEWVFIIVIITHFFLFRSSFQNYQIVIILTLLVVLILQTFWLLPKLDARAELHIEGAIVKSSFFHLYYVIGEVLKVIGLSLLIIKHFKPMS